MGDSPKLPDSTLENIEKAHSGREGVLGIKGFECVIYPYGLEGAEYARLALSSAAVWIIINSGDENFLMLTEQADRTADDGSHPWELPSGRADTDIDQDIFQTVVREVLEETGIKISTDQLVPLSVAQRGDVVEYDVDLPEVPIEESFGDFFLSIERLLHNPHEKVGLIFVSFISITELDNMKFLQRNNDGIFIDPPNTVDRTEISRIALVPIDDVLNDESNLFNTSIHKWASRTGLHAMRAKFSTY